LEKARTLSATWFSADEYFGYDLDVSLKINVGHFKIKGHMNPQHSRMGKS